MNVARRELSKELYELSGWWEVETKLDMEYMCPFYSLGYLLRQLPKINLENDGFGWIATYGGEYGRADTPENAACKLSIKLIKQRVLEKHA